MTLGQFLEALNQNPAIVGFYYVALPLTAILAGIFGRGEGDISPWKYLYTALIYLAFIPGIFAIILNLYLIVIERQSILDFNLYTQLLPIVGMAIVLMIVRRNVDLNAVPGFGKLTGLIWMITVALVLLWILEKAHIVFFSQFRFSYFIVFLIALLILFRWGYRRVFE